MLRDQVFISYSHADRKWLERLHTQLKPIVRVGAIDVWDDRRIKGGARWQDEIAAAVARARVAVLLVTPSFLASDFIVERELPAILSAAKAEGLVVLWVAVKYSAFFETDIASYQAVNDPARPLSAIHHAHVDRELVRICARVKEAFGDAALPATVVPAAAAAAKTSSTRHRPRQWPEANRLIPPVRPSTASDVTERERVTAALEAAVERRRELAALGVDVANVNQEILTLKRLLRGGGRLRQGDSLGDGRYLLIETIGKGGFATVWRAQDRHQNRRVAIKVLHAELAGDPVRRDRFLRGARIMRELAHECIVAILDPDGEDDGFHYIVMELMTDDLRRRTLARPFSASVALALIRRVGDALAVAHRRGLVHRDVKPANILLDSDDRPRLTDFDLVGGHETTGGTRTGALGTFLYAAPELMERPQEATPAADVYSLAATTIFLLLGKDLPHEFLRNPAAVVARLPCDPSIGAVLTRAIHLDPGARFPDAAALCDALAKPATFPILSPPRSRIGPAEATGRNRFPRSFGPYVLVKRLARGEMGAIYLAVNGQAVAPQLCAIKTVQTGPADREYVKRFRHEARLAARLEHPNLVHVFDAGEVDGELYLCMNFVDGRDLRTVWNRCARKGVAFPIHVAAFIVRELVLGLDYAHRLPEVALLHRAVSPPNVLLSFEGTVQLTDFGAASSTLEVENTAPGIHIDQLKYMSPEQARGESVDGRADLFASGIILWELLTGRQLYRDKPVEGRGDNWGQLNYLLHHVRAANNVAPSSWTARVPERMDRVVMKALAPRVEDRYETCAEFAGDLAVWCPANDEPPIKSFLAMLFAEDIEEERREREAMVVKAKVLLGNSSRQRTTSHF